MGYREEKAQTYLGETFWKSVPPKQHNSAFWESDEEQADAGPSIELVSFNHAALGVQDVDNMIK